MLITLSRRTAICQSVSEVQLTGVTAFGAVSHRFNILSIEITSALVTRVLFTNSY